MLSSGQHNDDTEKESQTEVFDLTTVKTSGRLVSTRDLMKWCSRVACHITNTDTTVANRAFQVCTFLLSLDLYVLFSFILIMSFCFFCQFFSFLVNLNNQEKRVSGSVRNYTVFSLLETLELIHLSLLERCTSGFLLLFPQ